MLMQDLEEIFTTAYLYALSVIRQWTQQFSLVYSHNSPHISCYF